MVSNQHEVADTRLLSRIEWERWRDLRYDCEGITSLLRAQVPVLEFVKWKVTKFEPGLIHTILPLVPTATNQHCTHQAALFFLAADYTGGLALGSIVPDYPVAGVHPSNPLQTSMALWSARGEIKYCSPSMGCLEAVAQIDLNRQEKIRRRFVLGKPVLESVPVILYNQSTPVAEAVMTYFFRRSDTLRTEGASPENANPLYQYKLISSAELIAGVRAKENGALFEDPFAARIAGEHGRALAERFYEKLPQLGGMVAARTRHLDQQILHFVRRGGRNLVLLGAGYDMRPFRLDFPSGMTVYELDFSTVLIDRQKRLQELGVNDPSGIRRIQIPIDLRSGPLVEVLKDRIDFSQPVFIAWEGMSMYFEEPEVRTILRGIHPVMQNPESRLWTDFASAEAVYHPDIYPEVKKFMEGMQILGEPFIFGTDSPCDFMKSNGFHCHEMVTSNVFLENSTDPVFREYQFCTASAERTAIPAVEIPEAKVLDVHAAHPLPAPISLESVQEVRKSSEHL
jgi:methyltransferase (TIGR00027 family)